MAFSTQRAVSDGTLQDLDLAIEYIDKEDINVFIDDVPQVEGVDYTWTTDTRIHFTVVVPNGQEVLLQRSTKLDKVLNIFTAGAVFNDPTMDENFTQMLYIAQEAREGATLEEIFNNLNMHGYKVQNMGPGTEPGDAINYQQYVDDALGAGNARAGAEAARDAAVAARDAAQGHASAASSSASAAAGSASAASTSASAAAASASTASTAATNASNSATAAATSETNAAASASAAAGSATSASNSATAAAANLLPLGGLFPYPSRVAIPPGFGAGDGILVNRATYPELWAAVNSGQFPSVSDATWLADPLERGKYSTGNGTTTFRLPDYNGVQAGSIGGLFFRGSASSAGAVLRDAFQEHVIGSLDGASKRYMLLAGNTGAIATNAGSGYSYPNTLNTQTHATAGVLKPLSDSSGADPRMASETRPMQVAGVWLIKMFGAPVNPGTVDVTQLASDVVALTGRVQALEARALGIGEGQTWQTFTSPTRAVNTTYQNTTGRSIEVAVSTIFGGSVSWLQVGATAGTLTDVSSSTGNGANVFGAAVAVIPPGHFYRFNSGGVAFTWKELRV